MNSSVAATRARDSAAAFFGRLAARRRKDESGAAIVGAGTQPPEVPPGLRRRIESLVCAEQARRWLSASLAVNVLVLIALVVGYTATFFRPTYAMVNPPSLKDAAIAHRTADGIDKDTLYMFLNYTLPLLNQVSPQGAPYLPLLQGAVEPSVYGKIRRDTEKNMGEVRKAMLTQNLVISGITDVIYDQNTGKLSAYVIGNLGAIAQQAAKGVASHIIPYRARVVLTVVPPSKVNPFPFFLSALEQRYDARATAWDATQLKKQ